MYNVRDGIIIVNRLGSVADALRREMEREHGIHITDDELRLLLPRFHAWADLAYDGWNRVRYRDLREYYTPAMAQAIEAKGPKTPKYLVLQDAMLSHRSTSTSRPTSVINPFGPFLDIPVSGSILAASASMLS